MSSSVSVVLPVFNADKWVGRTIRSVLEDSADALIVAVDDGSTDQSVEVIEGFGKDVILETGPNRGACHARNRGLQIAQEHGAEYVLFLDADDYLEGDMLAGALAEAKTHNADMVLSDMHEEFADGTREIRHLYESRVPPEALFTGWMQGRYVNPSGILWRCDFMERIGRWDESLARAQDLEVTLRAMLFSPVIFKNDQGAAIHARVNDNSISRSQSEKALNSRFRAVSGLIEKVRGTRFADNIPLLQREIYHIARAAFKAGYRDLGREGTRLLRDQGYRDHPGTTAHRYAATLLGLETKVRLWKA